MFDNFDAIKILNLEDLYNLSWAENYKKLKFRTSRIVRKNIIEIVLI